MAARYWTGNATPTSSNWNYNSGGITNWGSASGVADNVAPPTSSDDVIFDGASVKGNANSTISANITILSLTFTSGYTGTVTENSNIVLTITGNFTDNTAHNWTINSTNTGALTISSASTITSNGKIFPGNVTFASSGTKTLVGDWNVTGLITSSTDTQTVNKTTNEVLYSNGYFNLNAQITGSITLRITGGTISTYFNNGTISVNEVILDGNITFSGPNYIYYFSVPNFSYVSGTITNSNLVTLQVINSGTYNWNLNPILFNGLTVGNPSGQIFNLISKFNVRTIFGSSNVVLTFTGNFGFECSNFNITIVNGNNVVIKEGITYIVNSSFQLYAYGGFSTTTSALVSSSAVNRAILVLKNGAASVSNSRFTRIDASGGRIINTWNGLVTDCINVRSFTDLQTVASSTII